VITEREMIEKLKVAAQWMEKAGAIIAVVMDPASRWWLEDSSAAVENMLIASTALGYGSCWIEGYTLPREKEFKAVSSQYSGENGECRSDLLSDQAAVSKTALHLPRFIEKILKALLNIPQEKRLLTLAPIGVPVEWPTREKKTLAQVIHWETY